jgi:hypothetical protein
MSLLLLLFFKRYILESLIDVVHCVAADIGKDGNLTGNVAAHAWVLMALVDLLSLWTTLEHKVYIFVSMTIITSYDWFFLILPLLGKYSSYQLGVIS